MSGRETEWSWVPNLSLFDDLPYWFFDTETFQYGNVLFWFIPEWINQRISCPVGSLILKHLRINCLLGSLMLKRLRINCPVGSLILKRFSMEMCCFDSFLNERIRDRGGEGVIVAWDAVSFYLSFFDTETFKNQLPCWFFDSETFQYGNVLFWFIPEWTNQRQGRGRET